MLTIGIIRKLEGERMIWSKHKNSIVFVLISMIGLLSYLYDNESIIWQFITIVGVATTLSLAVLAFMTYLDYAKGEDIVKVYFQFPNKSKSAGKIYTKLYTKRKHFTRGEVMGLLRMIQKNQGQFKIKDFNENTEILKRFNDIQNGISNELIIITTKKEQEQFWLLGEKEKCLSLHARLRNK